MPREPSETELLKLAGDRAREDGLSIVVGKIVSYNHMLQTAEAQPAVTGMPIIEGPVGYMGGSWRVFGPLVEGDDCLILLCSKDPTNYILTGNADDGHGPIKAANGALWGIIMPLKISLPKTYVDAALSTDLRVGDSSEIAFGSVLQLGGPLAFDPVVVSSLLVAALNTIITGYNVHTHSGGGAGPPVTPMVPFVAVGSSTIAGTP